ncbi:hypothetical protein P7C70_g212, partial [Phenoliferia sp. Uapishka_3]
MPTKRPEVTTTAPVTSRITPSQLPVHTSPTSALPASSTRFAITRSLLPPPFSRRDSSSNDDFDPLTTRPVPLPPVLGQIGPAPRTRAAQRILAPFESRIMTRNRRGDEGGSGSATKPGAPSVFRTDYREASDSDGSHSGSVSDGDPPGYVAPTGIKAEVLDNSKRNYEELEDITFSNPNQFISMAFAIAASRGTSLIVADDRTNKTVYPYMHLCCTYRRSGCPLILKLSKAKEGGWEMKASSSGELEVKQRSVYICRHTIGPKMDYPAVGVVPSTSTIAPTPTAAPHAIYPPTFPPHLSAPPPPRAASLSQPKPFSPGITPPIVTADSPEFLLVPKRGRGRQKKVRSVLIVASDGESEAPNPPVVVKRPVGRPPKNRNLIAPMQTSKYVPTAPQPGSDTFDREKILAPPFQRSMGLSTLVAPALSAIAKDTVSYGIPLSQVPIPALSYRPSVLAPVVKPSPYARASDEPPSKTIYSWTSFLKALDSTLVDPFAIILSSSFIDVSPVSFFEESEEMRIALIDELEGVGKWAKVRLKTKIIERGVAVWTAVKESLPADGEIYAAAKSDTGKGRDGLGNAHSAPAAGLDSLTLFDKSIPPSQPTTFVEASCAKADSSTPTVPSPAVVNSASTPSPFDAPEVEVEADPSVDGEELSSPYPDSDLDGAEIVEDGKADTDENENNDDDDDMDTASSAGSEDWEGGVGQDDAEMLGGLVSIPVESEAPSEPTIFEATRERKRKAEAELKRDLKKASSKPPKSGPLTMQDLKFTRVPRMSRGSHEGPFGPSDLSRHLDETPSPTLAIQPLERFDAQEAQVYPTASIPATVLPPPFRPPSTTQPVAPPSVAVVPSPRPPSAPIPAGTNLESYPPPSVEPPRNPSWRRGAKLSGALAAAPVVAELSKALPAHERATMPRYQLPQRDIPPPDRPKSQPVQAQPQAFRGAQSQGQSPIPFQPPPQQPYQRPSYPSNSSTSLSSSRSNYSLPNHPRSTSTQSPSYSRPQTPVIPRAYQSQGGTSGSAPPRASYQMQQQQAAPVVKGSYERKVGVQRRERSVE